MDSGNGQTHESLWLTLTPAEVHEFRDRLNQWLADKPDDPIWHFHIVDSLGRILTVDVAEPDDPRFVPRAGG